MVITLEMFDYQIVLKSHWIEMLGRICRFLSMRITSDLICPRKDYPSTLVFPHATKIQVGVN